MMAGDRVFSGKVAVVTGGSSGIGLALGKKLVQQGADVWLVARRSTQLAEARQQILHDIGNVQSQVGTIPADISDPDQAFDCIQQIEEQTGRIDYLFNSAGFVHPGYVQDLALELFRQMMEVNYYGTVYMTKAALPGMIQRRSGHIINIGSLGAVVSYIGYSAYAPSKYAVRGFSDALRSEMKSYHVQVSIVYPGYTNTPQLAYENRYKPPETKYIAGMGKVYSPDEVAEAILKGVQRGRYVIVPGTRIRLLYRAIAILGEAINPIIDSLIIRSRKQME